MTVCLAAICESGKNILSLSDQMIGFQADETAITTVDGAVLKDSHIHKNWFALYAADDVADVSPIIDRATVMMCRDNDERPLAEVGKIFMESFMLRHQDKIHFGLLKPLGFHDYDDFHERGKNCLPESEHVRILQKIETLAPQCAFLVGGFGPMGLGHLFMQKANSAWDGLDELGWWAIGSGHSEAVTTMEYYAKKFGFSIKSSFSHAAYCLLAAKFMSEVNGSVGKETFIALHSYNEPVRYLPSYYLDAVRKEWEKVGTARIPKLLIRKLSNAFKTSEQIQNDIDNIAEFVNSDHRKKKR